MEDRSQYLSLAQLSQGVVRSILLYLEADRVEPLKVALQKIVDPLEAYLSAEPVAQTTAFVPNYFASYEELNTLSEAWGESETRDVVERLRKFLAAQDGPAAKHEAEALIGPFQKLSTQALLNFEQPEAGLPRGIFELCRAQ